MLTQHKQTQLFKVTKLTQNTILQIIFTPKLVKSCSQRHKLWHLCR